MPKMGDPNAGKPPEQQSSSSAGANILGQVQADWEMWRKQVSDWIGTMQITVQEILDEPYVSPAQLEQVQMEFHKKMFDVQIFLWICLRKNPLNWFPVGR